MLIFKIILHTYNWAKELIEVLMKQIVLLGQWLSARSNLLVGVIHQKMGLFFNQPITRKHDGQVSGLVSEIFKGEELIKQKTVNNLGPL